MGNPRIVAILLSSTLNYVDYMKTPEKSVKEIVEEFRRTFFPHRTEEWLTQIIQTERQKREELVEEERERIKQVAQSNYDPTRGWILCTPEDLFFTQTNNPK
jgi:hypothetical protein